MPQSISQITRGDKTFSPGNLGEGWNIQCRFITNTAAYSMIK